MSFIPVCTVAVRRGNEGAIMMNRRGSAWGWARQGRPGSVSCAHSIKVFIVEGATGASYSWSLVDPGYVKCNGHQGVFLG